MKKPGPKTLEEKLLPCMAYLYGDVAGDQFRAACRYKYARESKILPKIAELYRRKAVGIFHQIDHEFPAAGEHLINHECRVFWQCPSFPEKSWNELSKAERSDLLWGLPCSVQPLLFEKVFPIPSLDQLKSMLLSGWKEARADGRPIVVESPDASFVYAVLPLDFSKSRKRVRQEIDDWLELPDNKARFDKHKLATEAGTEKQAKDRLKYLVAWRIYRELGWKGAVDFIEQHRDPDRQFHDRRQGQSTYNQAPLYSEQSGFLRAIARAQAYLGELFPWEFGRIAGVGDF
jgi:hypothetical protein